jgi:hypothetical protein
MLMARVGELYNTAAALRHRLQIKLSLIDDFLMNHPEETT